MKGVKNSFKKYVNDIQLRDQRIKRLSLAVWVLLPSWIVIFVIWVFFNEKVSWDLHFDMAFLGLSIVLIYCYIKYKFLVILSVIKDCLIKDNPQ
jgi:hypothetical protein